VVLEFWAGLFPQRKPTHFVFPFEKCGGKGKDKLFGFKGGVSYGTDPSKPTGDWKEAWEYAKRRAGVALNPEAKNPKPLVCRFHDLRHTGCTRMLESGVPFSVVAVIMGWSASTAVRMAKRYSHIGDAARCEAIDKLGNASTFDAVAALGWAQKWAQSQSAETGPVQ
jgi:integrase